MVFIDKPVVCDVFDIIDSIAKPSFINEWYEKPKLGIDVDSVINDDKSVTFTIDLPGVKESELVVEVKDNKHRSIVYVDAKRKTATVSSTISKSFAISDEYDSSTLEASLQDGVLTLHVQLKKQQEEKLTGRKVPISSK